MNIDLTPEDYLVIFLGLVLYWFIIYLIIKAAVAGVNSNLSEQNELLKQQLRIMKRQLQKEGLNNAEISTVITKDQ